MELIFGLEKQSLFPHASWILQENTMQPCLYGVPLSDRGFRYGQHLFETVAVRHGRIFFAEDHLDRLAQLAIQHHFGFDTAWRQGASLFLKTTPFPDGVVRIFLTAGDGSLGAPITQPRLFAFWEEITFPSVSEIEQGVTLVSLQKHLGNEYWGLKNGNYWDHICALKEAQRGGASEGLVFNAEDYLISGAMANVILWIKKNHKIQMITPPCTRGARDGVVLHWVRQQFPELLECDLTRSDLMNVRAMALTNSRLGVMPVQSLEGRRLPDFHHSLELAKKYESL
ncbi:MAG: aminotransferase class IV [Chthoniobacterales bacterium]